jgi:hypothetical protein
VSACLAFAKLSILILPLYSVDVASFFEPSIQCIIDSVEEQLKNAHKKFTVSFSAPLSTHSGYLILWINSMLFLWEALPLAIGFTNKSLKF